MTIFKPHRQEDSVYLEWLPQQREFLCLICGRPAERCHLESVGSRGSDYRVFPACHDCHMKKHSGSQQIRTGTWERALSSWFLWLPHLWGRYVSYLSRDWPDQPLLKADAMEAFRTFGYTEAQLEVLGA